MKKQAVIPKGKVSLDNYNPDYDGGLDKEKTKETSDELKRRIGDLQQLLYANSTKAILLIFQGLDASGKDGSVRHVLEEVNPAGVETSNFKVPSTEERAHDYLWRIHKAIPRYGNIGVFNRSHYEAVLVERVLNIVPKAIWSERYDQIVAFEKMLSENNVVILKFFLHISKEEQKARLEERLHNPKKNWKFASSDLDTRKLWKEYMTAYEDMLSKTNHKAAPWHIIPANKKWYRNFLISKTLADAMGDLKMDWPRPKEDLSAIKIV